MTKGLRHVESLDEADLTRLRRVTDYELQLLQLDRVALHLVVEGGALNTEKFCRFFLVSVAFSERLNNRSSFNVVEALHARARQRGALGLLQRGWQLYFCRQLFDAIMPCRASTTAYSIAFCNS